MKKYTFSEIFEENPDGSLTLKERVNVNGVVFGPGVSFKEGVSFGGVNFHKYKNFDIAVVKDNNILIVEGFYK